MIPLADSVASRQRPVVTQVIIGLCVAVFLYELTLRGAALDRFVERWGAVPRLILAALAGSAQVPRTELVTLLTSQFIHAGFLHLGGNMLFLWVFGRAVEDRLGHAVYVVFYLVAGALAGLTQVAISGPTEAVPLVGASGAIAGVLGAYFISYPTAWVRVLVPVLFFFWAFDLPALLVLAFWFVSQFFSGIAAITHASGATNNVAIWAHVAGFVLGAAAAKVLPAQVGGALPKAGPTGIKRAEAPGPARLVSSVADLLALLLAARLVLRFFGLALLAAPVAAVTEPIVDPFRELLPSLRVAGGILEVYTLVAIVAVYLIAGLVGQLFVKRSGS